MREDRRDSEAEKKIKLKSASGILQSFYQSSHMEKGTQGMKHRCTLQHSSQHSGFAQENPGQ